MKILPKCRKMAFLQPVKSSFTKSRANLLKICLVFIHNKADKQMLEQVQEQIKREEKDMPIEMENPFSKKKPECILCKYNIEPNFRNVRLLSQFVSSYTGRIYGRHITGLCKEKQRKVEMEIRRAQESGLMGVYTKDPKYLTDPDLYDPMKPFRAL